MKNKLSDSSNLRFGKYCRGKRATFASLISNIAQIIRLTLHGKHLNSAAVGLKKK